MERITCHFNTTSILNIFQQLHHSCVSHVTLIIYCE